MRERDELEEMLHDADKAERRLAARTRGGAPEDLLTSEELAARTGLRT